MSPINLQSNDLDDSFGHVHCNNPKRQKINLLSKGYGLISLIELLHRSSLYKRARCKSGDPIPLDLRSAFRGNRVPTIHFQTKLSLHIEKKNGWGESLEKPTSNLPKTLSFPNFYTLKLLSGNKQPITTRSHICDGIHVPSLVHIIPSEGILPILLIWRELQWPLRPRF